MENSYFDLTIHRLSLILQPQSISMNKKYNFVLPVLLALCVAFGMLIGMRFNPYNRPVQKDFSGKFNEILELIDMAYVDTVNINNLTEDAIRKMLMELDPHSVYLTKSELIASMQDLEGNFEGIGIEFNILNDTILVVSPIAGGPSESIGIRAGDKIIYINDELVAGKGIKTTDVRSKLLGKKGTKVTIKIKRKSVESLIEYTITRDRIPFFSIDASYMVDKTTGYIKINRFSAETYNEFNKALSKLLMEGMTQLILDLSGNPGGYLDAAIKIADHFFDKQKLLVYTEGRQRKRRDYYSESSGLFTNGKLVVIIDEGSASASEIMAGAIQDWDRGLIVGRRSFGKALVQEPLRLSDSSEIRLTVARYYTPIGRFIQKPYQNGSEEYYMEMYHRFSNGQLVSKDSNLFPDSLKYKTFKGRTVYGGGGIMPDIFVPLDTTYRNQLLADINQNGLFNSFTIQYVDNKRNELKNKYPDFKIYDKQFQSVTLKNEFVNYIQQNGIKYNENEFKLAEKIIFNRIDALIARNLFGDNAFFKIINEENPEFLKALETIKSNDFLILN